MERWLEFTFLDTKNKRTIVIEGACFEQPLDNDKNFEMIPGVGYKTEFCLTLNNPQGIIKRKYMKKAVVEFWIERMIDL